VLAAVALATVGLAAPTPARADEPAHAPPPSLENLSIRAETALIHDLEKIVESQEATDWKIDRYEYDGMFPDALESVCATPQPVREAALARLTHRVAALGGPVEQAYLRAGKQLSAVATLRFVTRVRTLLEESMKRAPSECPFWIEPSYHFRGKQTAAGRWTIEVEGGGLFAVYHQNGSKSSVGGGGSGRLFLSRGLDYHWTLLFGPDFGGAALFSQTATGEFPIVLTAALPIVLRRHDTTWHYDLELAPIAQFTNLDHTPSWGGRVGALVGISTPRFRRIMPWVGLGVAAEWALPSSTRNAARSLRGGIRLGFDWDFSGEIEE
jgi:hypothetical protein